MSKIALFKDLAERLVKITRADNNSSHFMSYPNEVKK